jgi:O-antigen ligase
MDKARASLVEKLLFLYLLVFPFGQLLAVKISFLGNLIRVHPADIIVLLISAVVVLGKTPVPKFFKSFRSLLLLGVFGLFFSLSLFELSRVTVGALYFLRGISYAAFFLAVYHLAKARNFYKETLFKSLIVISFEVALVGLVQYFFLPDLRFLFALGWDDHLYRLAGTFLDPGFTAIIIAFGAVLSLAEFLKRGGKLFFLTLVVFLVSLLLTYSRASFLAFGAALVVLFVKTRKKLILAVAALFLLAVPFLPRPEGYGVRLERTHSIVSRFKNYGQTFEIFKKSPLFGIGFNNICAAKALYLQDKAPESHSCSGADSSLLLVLATTGIAGLIIFIHFIRSLLGSIGKNIYSFSFLACLAALLLHSQFVNSLIYPWVMGYMAILGGIGLAGAKGRS